MSMMIPEVELRVLGSLIEKQSTTPEYYPMTLKRDHQCLQSEIQSRSHGAV